MFLMSLPNCRLNEYRIVLADWHGAESFARNPERFGKIWDGHSSTLKYIHTHYDEPQVIVLPGDSQSGKWYKREFIDALNSSLSAEEAVYQAGQNCYRTMKDLFAFAGFMHLLMAVGDHELGGNNWQPGSDHTELVPQFRRTFAEGFNTDESGSFLFSSSIGTEPSTPIGTPFSSTSYAYQHNNVLFITVDAFRRMWDAEDGYFDREQGLGGEGML